MIACLSHEKAGIKEREDSSTMENGSRPARGPRKLVTAGEKVLCLDEGIWRTRESDSEQEYRTSRIQWVDVRRL